MQGIIIKQQTKRFGFPDDLRPKELVPVADVIVRRITKNGIPSKSFKRVKAPAEPSNWAAFTLKDGKK